MNPTIPLLVIDTSVVAKWFLYEADTDKAEAIRKDYQAERILLVAPDIMLVELANALYFSRQFTAPEINKIVRQLKSDLLIEGVTLTHCEMAIPAMFRYKAAIYDLLFLALAMELGTQLITADAQFYNRLRNGQPPDLSRFVRLLGTF